LDGIVVLAGNAPTSLAVYVGLFCAFAHAGTVGSVSVNDCNAVAPALAPERILSKSDIASCFPFHVSFSISVTNLCV
jgi:hypothetical protein